MAIKQTISTSSGHLVALTTSGDVYRQQRVADGSDSLEWAVIGLEGVDGKVVEIMARPTDGSLVVRTADGCYHEQHSSYRAGVWQWRELAGPPGMP
jgi:hypothetical protein